MSDQYRMTQGGFDVVFAFATTGLVAAPGPLLVRVLGEIGYQEAAARNQIIRMVNRDLIGAERTGRFTVYRLSELMVFQMHRLSGGVSPAPWQGSFATLLYDVPETERSLRDRVRYMAGHFGYGLLRPGAMIAVAPAPSPVPAIGPMPEGVLLEEATLTPPDDGAAARLADRAWSLASLNRDYRALVETLESALRDGLPRGQAGVRAWHNHYLRISRTRMADPQLAAALLPPDWAGARAIELQDAFDRRFGPAVRAGLLDRVEDPAWTDLCEVNPLANPPVG